MSENKSLVVVGDGGVGKTSIILRYTRNTFSEGYNPTLQDSFTATIELPDKSKIEINIEDTAGQEEYSSLRDKFLENGDIFFIVYSIVDAGSLNVAKEFLTNIKNLREKNFKFVLLGNKCDLPNRKVSTDDGKHLANQFGGLFFETSAKKVININEAFQAVGKLISEKKQEDGCACRI